MLWQKGTRTWLQKYQIITAVSRRNGYASKCSRSHCFDVFWKIVLKNMNWQSAVLYYVIYYVPVFRYIRWKINRTYSRISTMIKIVHYIKSYCELIIQAPHIRLYSYSVKINYGHLAAIKIMFHKLKFKDLITHLYVFKCTENDYYYLLCVRKIYIILYIVCVFCLRVLI